MGLLENTYLVYQAAPFTKNIDKEISGQPKLYFADTGILNILAAGRLSTGQVFENAIAVQLKNQGTIQYYQKKSGQEIDFIFNGDTAVEVKETPTQPDLQTIAYRASALKIDKYFIVGRYPAISGFTQFVWGGSIY